MSSAAVSVTANQTVPSENLKVTDVTLTVFEWKLAESVTYTRMTTPKGGVSTLGLVTIHTNAGIEGHAFLGSSTRPVDIDARGVIDVLKPLVMGKNPLARDRIYDDFRNRSRTVMMRSIGAMDVALWDIGGKAANMPIHRMIGSNRDKVPVYASSSTLHSVEDYVEQALKVKSEGYRAYKMHPPHDKNVHVKMLREVRKAVGDDYPLMYDPAMIYSFAEAVRIGRVLEELGYLWLEDPLAIDDMYNYTKLCAELDIMVMATEYTPNGFHGFSQWIMTKATDALRGDVAVKGGITACLKAAHLAEAFHMPFEIHHGGNSLNNVANLQIMQAIPNCEYFEVLTPHTAHKYGLVTDLEIDKDGYLAASNKPGLGADIDFDLIKRNTVAVLR